jgi:hypothetical protein
MKWWRRIHRTRSLDTVTLLLYRKTRHPLRGVTFKFFGYQASKELR